MHTNNWIDKYQTTFLDIPYQHIVFTVPDILWPIIQIYRKIGLNILAQAATRAILLHTKNKFGYTPAIMAVIHTFGRDLKFNPHIHLLVSCGGLSKCKTKWIHNSYLHHLALKRTWRYQIITTLREAIKSGEIKMDPRILDKAYSSESIYDPCSGDPQDPPYIACVNCLLGILLPMRYTNQHGFTFSSELKTKKKGKQVWHLDVKPAPV